MVKPVLWSPFQDFMDLHDRMSQLMNERFESSSTGFELPATDVYEQDNEIIVEASLPTFTEKDINVHIANSGIEIKAMRQEDRKETDKKRKYYVRESRSGTLYRFIALPAHADKEKASAHFENGVLRIVIPLKAQAAPKKLTIATKPSKSAKK